MIKRIRMCALSLAVALAALGIRAEDAQLFDKAWTSTENYWLFVHDCGYSFAA